MSFLKFFENISLLHKGIGKDIRNWRYISPLRMSETVDNNLSK